MGHLFVRMWHYFGDLKRDPNLENYQRGLFRVEGLGFRVNRKYAIVIIVAS